MIVGIVKIDTGLVILEEFISAVDIATAITDFCDDYEPVLTESDYLGIDCDGIDLKKQWAWDFSGSPPALVETIYEVGLLVPATATTAARAQVYVAYDIKTADGLAFVNKIRADLYLMIVSAAITPADAFYIEGKLSDTSILLSDGNWLTAQNTIAGITIEGAYTQSIHDDIKDPIDDYVAANYQLPVWQGSL